MHWDHPILEDNCYDDLISRCQTVAKFCKEYNLVQYLLGRTVF